MNTLYYGENLKVLREHIKDESVDLIYRNPPTPSNAAAFKQAEKTGRKNAKQGELGL